MHYIILTSLVITPFFSLGILFTPGQNVRSGFRVKLYHFLESQSFQHFSLSSSSSSVVLFYIHFGTAYFLQL